MQVERERGQPRVEWRTGEQYIGTFPVAGDNPEKSGLIPHTIHGCKGGTGRPHTIGVADAGLASWWGNGIPRRRSVAGLRERPATLVLTNGPYTYGKQHLG